MNTKYLIAKSEAKSNMDVLKSSFLSCFVEVTSYLQSHLPHDSIFIRDLSCFQPGERFHALSIASAGRVAILKNTSFLTNQSPEEYSDLIRMEYRMYQSEKLEFSDDVFDDIEVYWSAVEKVKDQNGTFKFKALAVLVITCLCISHGNATPERGFSINKAVLDHRTSLDEETIIALRIVKEAILLYGGILKIPITRKLLTFARNSHAAYEVFLENKRKIEEESQKENPKKRKKNSKTEEKNEKRAKLVSIENSIAMEEKKKKAAVQLIAAGNEVLESALNSNKISREEVTKGKMMVASGLRNSEETEDLIRQLQEEKKTLSSV